MSKGKSALKQLAHRMRYLSLIKTGILDAMSFRMALLVTTVGNLIYLVLVYYLWKSIFASSATETVRGMTFGQTMIYLVFASALFRFCEMWTVWNMGRDIQSGQIVVDLLKPVKYRTWCFFGGFGETVVKFVTTFLPTAIVVYFVSGGAIKLSWNLLWFVVSCVFSLLIHFLTDFFTGTICVYTESIWGVDIMKQVIVGLLSGATIPIAFFPGVLHTIVMLLPFQAICNTPIEILLHPEYGIAKVATMIGLQLFWVFVMLLITDAFFAISLKKITVNGG